jgi:Leucine Rich Repeat (LRR) protein
MQFRANKRRRFRFTFRSLMVTVTALSVLPAMVTPVYRWRATESRERQAQIDLNPYGGVYSMASAVHVLRTRGQSKGWFFETFLNHVEAVDLSPHNWSAMKRRQTIVAVDDDALANLRLYRFRNLRSLDLRDTQITDEGVPHIAALKRLQQLDIRGTQITDGGLQELRGALPNCEISR